MRGFLLLSLLVTQAPDLERELKATRNGTDHALITIIARHADGRPYRGAIQCSGQWFKHEDGDVVYSGTALPFQTDSRGAIVMNPKQEDVGMLCWAGGGQVIVNFSDPTGVYEITTGDL